MLPRSGSSSSALLVTFFHKYRWGDQIRGDERGFYEKARALHDRGIETYVLEQEPSLQDDIGAPVYLSLRVRGCKIPPRHLGDIVVLLFHALRRIGGRAWRRPLAVYAYNQDPENVLIGFALKIVTGAPLVVIYHQVDRSSAQWFGDGFRDRRSRGFSVPSAIWHSTLPSLNRLALAHADVSLALSETTRADVEKVLGEAGCVNVGNGLDSSRFRPVIMPKLYDGVFLGRLAHQKGIDILLKAWRLVVDSRIRAKLLLIGGGESSAVQGYKRMIRELNLGDNVELVGFVSDDELVKKLNSSRLFVFPSRKEGFAQAVSQAMGCGMCCVLSSIPSLLENYPSAVFVPVENHQLLGSKVLQLLSDDRTRDEIGSRARGDVIKLSWQSVVDRELRAILEASRNE